MKEISSTDAARRFSEVLAAVEHGRESFVIRRHGRAVARLEPATAATVADVLKIMKEHPVDAHFARDIEEVRELLVSEPRAWPD